MGEERNVGHLNHFLPDEETAFRVIDRVAGMDADAVESGNVDEER